MEEHKTEVNPQTFIPISEVGNNNMSGGNINNNEDVLMQTPVKNAP